MNSKILFFSSPWCGPCKQIKNRLNEENIKELNIEIIDISEDMDFATKHEITVVPTFVKIVDGKEVSRKSGSVSIEGLKSL